VNQPASSYRIRSQTRDKVRILTLDRPDKLNAFTAAGYQLLTGELERAATAPEVSACVLTGNGRAFSSGVDLTEMTRPGGPEELRSSFDPLVAGLAAFPKPLFAAVNGLAIGFGATMLLHCDVVVVDELAQIRMPFVTLGTCAEAGSSWLLPQRVGMQRAMWMMMSASPLDAAAAVASGFALATAPTGQVLEDTLALAREVAAHQVAALIANKRLLRQGWAGEIDAAWQRERAAMQAIAEELGPIGS
jgi:enoyl-CoA hydratase/carnithine racemase